MDDILAKYAKIPVRQRLLAFVGILVLLVGGFWFLFYADQAEKLDRLKQQFMKLENERAEKQAYIDNLAKYEARLTELQASLDQARAQLPDDPDVPQLLAQLGVKAHNAGLVIDRFEPKGESVGEFFAEIIFALKVRGSYHEIGTFLDSLAKLDRIINVTGIAMTSPKTVNQKVEVDGAFTLKTYRFVDAKEAAAAKAKKKGKKKK